VTAVRPRALLIQPPIHDFALYDLFLHPFGLLRIGEWLERSGYEVELLDCLDDGTPRANGVGRFHRTVIPTPAVLSDIDRTYARYGVSQATIRRRIAEFRPMVILITTGMTYWYPGVVEAVGTASTVLPGVPIILGGVYATLLPGHVRSVATRAHIVQRDAESLSGLLRDLGLPLLVGGLPATPSVRLQLSSRRLSASAVLRLNVGCPRRCAYCASPLLSRAVCHGRWRTAADRIRTMVEHGIRVFAFYDDALLDSYETGLGPLLEWVISVYGERTLAFYTPNGVHIGLVTAHAAELMRHAGFREIRLGIESLDEEFHEHYDEKQGTEGLARAVEALESAGFRPGEISGYLLAGLPGQNAISVDRSITQTGSFGVLPHISEYSPIPGTPLFEEACRVSRYPLRAEPLCHNNSAFPTASERFTQSDLEEIKRSARRIRASLTARSPG
jgi:hypothetical protein